MAREGYALVLDDGQEYFCVEELEIEGRRYLYLVTTDEPAKMRFAELINNDGEESVRIIGDEQELKRIVKAFQEKMAAENGQND